MFPLIVQGPLSLIFRDSSGRLGIPRIENAALTGRNPPSPERLAHWRRAQVTVQGRPDWIFVKLHCHGMDPNDEPAMLGTSLQRFLQYLVEGSAARGERIHFVTAREMVNILLAACDQKEGDPGDYRNYRLQLFRPSGCP